MTTNTTPVILVVVEEEAIEVVEVAEVATEEEVVVDTTMTDQLTMAQTIVTSVSIKGFLGFFIFCRVCSRT